MTTPPTLQTGNLRVFPKVIQLVYGRIKTQNQNFPGATQHITQSFLTLVFTGYVTWAGGSRGHRNDSYGRNLTMDLSLTRCREA